MLIGRRAPRRARDLTPTFRQSDALTRPLLTTIVGEFVQTVVPSRIPASHRPNCQDFAPLVEISASLVYPSADESSQGEEEEAPLKRWRIEVDGKVTENEGPIGADPGLATAVAEGRHNFGSGDCAPFKCGGYFFIRDRHGRRRMNKGNRGHSGERTVNVKVNWCSFLHRREETRCGCR